ncbi:MAG: dihydrolipoyl dehydrogenase [Pseudomonadota bacterium]
MTKRYTDVAVIGAGSAGLSAYRAAKATTDNVVLIEGGPYGTTCARVGCMPSKLLIAAAEAAHGANEAARFGVNVDNIDIDGRAVMGRVRRERDRFVGFVVDGVESIPATDRVRGYAEFVSDNELRITNESDRSEPETTVVADRIVIATGSSPSVPAMFADLGDRLIVNDDVFDWDDLPGSIAVFGPGVIGLELGQALHRLGVEVHLFGLGGLLGPISDPAVLDDAQQIFRDEFFVDTDADVRGLRRVHDGVEVSYRDRDSTKTTIVDYVLAATGRRPSVAGLKLENTSLPLDARGLPVFSAETLQIGDSRVFIAGDANNHLPLLHEAADEGRIAGLNAARYPNVAAGLRRSPIAVVFSDPQIGLVGQSFASLSERKIVVGDVSFDDQGRSRVMLKNRGRLRVYASPGDGRFLGAEMVGPRAEHIAHLLAWAHQNRMTITDMLEMPFYHPTIEEGVRTALRDAARQLEDRLPRAA